MICITKLPTVVHGAPQTEEQHKPTLPMVTLFIIFNMYFSSNVAYGQNLKFHCPKLRWIMQMEKC